MDLVHSGRLSSLICLLNMRILLVTPACHFSSRGAVQQDIYATIALLKKMGHEVALFSLDQPGQDRTVIEGLKIEYDIDCQIFAPPKSLGQWIKSLLHNPLLADRSAYPFYELARSSEFETYLGKYQPAAIISIGNYSWPLFKQCQKYDIRFIIRSHNFEPLHFWEELEPIARLNPINWLKFLARLVSEKKSVRVADQIAAISPAETDTYNQWGAGKAQLLPLVSLQLFTPDHQVTITKKPLDVFFLGATYNVPFHRRGAEALITEIAPAVHKQAPGEFRFHICGNKLPSELIKACDGQTVIYEGFVPDLGIFLQNMDVGVFPVWSGRGMKQKIFEAIARGFPVVVPRLSLGKYPVISGTHALVAEKPGEMVEQIISLRIPEIRATLSSGAAEFGREWFAENKFRLIFSSLLGL